MRRRQIYANKAKAQEEDAKVPFDPPYEKVDAKYIEEIQQDLLNSHASRVRKSELEYADKKRKVKGR